MDQDNAFYVFYVLNVFPLASDGEKLLGHAIAYRQGILYKNEYQGYTKTSCNKAVSRVKVYPKPIYPKPIYQFKAYKMENYYKIIL